MFLGYYVTSLGSLILSHDLMLSLQMQVLLVAVLVFHSNLIPQVLKRCEYLLMVKGYLNVTYFETQIVF